MLKRVQQQNKRDCGPVCLFMMINYYKGFIDLDTIKEGVKTGLNGTTAYDMIEYAKEIGFEAYGIKTDLKDIKIFPCIAHVIIDNSYAHYVVIEKVNKNVYVKDPANPKTKYSFLEFEKIFKGVILVMFPRSNIVCNPKYKIRDFLSQIIFSSKKQIRDLILTSIFITIFSIIVSYYLQVMLENIEFSDNVITLIFLLFLFVYVLKVITDYFRNKILTVLNEKIDFNLTYNTFKQIIILPYRYYHKHTTGEIVSKINDLEIVRTVINKVAIAIFIDLPLTIIVMFILYFISWELFLISLVMFILYVILSLFFKRIFRKYVFSCQVKKANYSSFMVEAIAGFESVKGCNKERDILYDFEDKFVDYLEKMYKFENVFNRQYFFKEVISNFGFLFIVFIGINLVRNEVMTLGSLLTFNSLLVYFLTPIRSIIDLDLQISLGRNAILRVLNYFKKDNDINLKRLKGSISVKNLDFGYDDILLKNINLEIKNGEKVLLAGSSGSGKSTLCKIIKGYCEINRNKVFIGDLDIVDFVNNNIVYLSQNEILFNNTIEYNVGNNKKIYDMCLVNEIINNLNLGKKTLVEENGFNFSGGQKQRMFLARALHQESDILIIDEGFSQMSSDMERKILKNIFSFYKNKLIIVISHRLDNLDLFDRFLRLEKGIIVSDEFKNI